MTFSEKKSEIISSGEWDVRQGEKIHWKGCENRPKSGEEEERRVRVFGVPKDVGEK